MKPVEEEEPLGGLAARLKSLRRETHRLEAEASRLEARSEGNIEERRRAIQAVRKVKGFRIFHTQDQLSEKDCFTWKGAVEDFLAFAKGAGATTLYVSEWEPSDDSPAPEAVGDLEVGFLFEGRLHVFSTVEYQEDADESEALGTESETVESYLNEHRAELIEEVVQRVLDHPDSPQSFGGIGVSELREVLRERLGGTTPLPSFHSFGDESSPVGREIVAEVGRGVAEKERPLIEKLYPKWLDFARQIGPATLSRGDLAVFLSRESARLTGVSQQSLWTKVKIELRNERTTEKLARGRARSPSP
jgi:hypothetical protein